MGQAALKLEAKSELLSISEIARRCGVDRLTCAKRIDALEYVADASSTAKLKLYPFVVEIVQAIVLTVYQEYTVRQPKRVATQLAKAKNVTQVKLVLKKDSDRIMKQLRENFEKFIG